MNNNRSIRPDYDYIRYLKETIKEQNFIGKFAKKDISSTNLKNNIKFSPIILVLFMDKNYVIFTYGCQDKKAKVFDKSNFEDWIFTQRQMISLKESKIIAENLLSEVTEKITKKGRR